MENAEEFSSDSSDEDYVPTELNGLSEEEDSGDAEDGPLDDSEDAPMTGKRKKKQSSKSSKRRGAIVLSHKRKGGIQLDDAAPTDEKNDTNVENRTNNLEVDEDSVRLAEAIVQEKEAKRAMEEKRKEDLLWADFMKDTKLPVKPKPSSSTSLTSNVTASSSASGRTSCTTSASTSSVKLDQRPPDTKVEIVKEFKFAGEIVKMSTMVDSNSKDAKQELIKEKTTDSPRLGSTSSATPSPLPFGSRRPAVGGLSSVLGKIDKTPKMSTLVKSKLDWDGFKSAEGIDDELKIHNRGKSGYLERQAFLERTDHRQFEIEKSLRLGSKPK